VSCIVLQMTSCILVLFMLVTGISFWNNHPVYSRQVLKASFWVVSTSNAAHLKTPQFDADTHVVELAHLDDRVRYH
jgi:hypothetical protein